MTKFSVEFGEVCTVNDSQGDLFFSEKQISDPLIFDPLILDPLILDPLIVDC